jgi:hypothetical protein
MTQVVTEDEPPSGRAGDHGRTGRAGFVFTGSCPDVP